MASGDPVIVGTGRFTGNVAIVTGASRGIGLSIAQRLASEGASVVVTARKIDPLVEGAKSMPEGQVACVAGSADDPEHQDAAVRTALDTFGRIDFLVNNAGINPTYGRLIDLDEAVGAKILAVNVLAALSWSQKVYHACFADSGGAIVNVASVAGVRAAPNIGMYGASKAALIHVTEELAVELGPSVRVNAVAPAVVRTRFAAALFEGREEQVIDTYPLKRLGEPADIAGAVGYLLSDDAAWVTGQTLVIDGGLTLGGGV